VGGSVLWPILNFGRLEANQQSADAAQQEALLNYQKTVLGALSDVEKSVTAYTKQEEYMASLEQTVKSNRSATDVARARYKDGLIPYLEVLDAERTLFASQSEAVQAKAQASQNLVAVYKSLGGGWRAAPAPAPATSK
jgi:outer membrane protein TolC